MFPHFLVAIADLTHPLSNNRSSVRVIGCIKAVPVTGAVFSDVTTIDYFLMLLSFFTPTIVGIYWICVIQKVSDAVMVAW